MLLELAWAAAHERNTLWQARVWDRAMRNCTPCAVGDSWTRKQVCCNVNHPQVHCGRLLSTPWRAMKTSLGSGRADTAMPCGGGQRGRDAIVVASCDWMRQWSFLPALWVLLERLKYHRKVPSRRSAPNSNSKAFGPFTGGRASCQRRISLCTRRCQHLLSKERRKTEKKVVSAAESCGWRFQIPGWEPGQEGKLFQSFRFGQSCRSPPHLQVLWQVPKAVLRDAATLEWNVVKVRMAWSLILRWRIAGVLPKVCGAGACGSTMSWESDLGGDVQESHALELRSLIRMVRSAWGDFVQWCLDRSTRAVRSEAASAGGSRTSSPSWSCARRAETEAREVGAGVSLRGRLDGLRVRAGRVVQRAEAGSVSVVVSSHSLDARLNDAFCTSRVESPSSPVKRVNDALRGNVPPRYSHNSHNSFAPSLHSLHGACGFVKTLDSEKDGLHGDVVLGDREGNKAAEYEYSEQG